MLGHWRCRETPRGKWWSRTSGCESQGSLGAETCLLRERNIGTASRVVEILLKHQNNSKQTCSCELFNGPEISLWKPNALHSVNPNQPPNPKQFNLLHNCLFNSVFPNIPRPSVYWARIFLQFSVPSFSYSAVNL
jgi:hypothetical protein